MLHIDTLIVFLIAAGERWGAADSCALTIGAQQAGAAGTTDGIARSRASRLGTRSTPQ
jgi:hypothetical protein